jgi:hypothetical protein
VSEDARNSIKLWAGGIAFALFFWAALHFDILAGVPDDWFWAILGILFAINLVQSVWIVVRRRAVKSDNLNG